MSDLILRQVRSTWKLLRQPPWPHLGFKRLALALCGKQTVTVGVGTQVGAGSLVWNPTRVEARVGGGVDLSGDPAAALLLWSLADVGRMCGVGGLHGKEGGGPDAATACGLSS